MGLTYAEEELHESETRVSNKGLLKPKHPFLSLPFRLPHRKGHVLGPGDTQSSMMPLGMAELLLSSKCLALLKLKPML